MEDEFRIADYVSSLLGESQLIRREKQGQGIHVPMFLDACITNHGNLQSAGRYGHKSYQSEPAFPEEKRYLQAADWDDVFFDAERLGIRIVFLSGGEPLMRRCILEKAANHHRIFFPVVTNGSLLDASYMDFLVKNRNLVPMLKIGPDMDVAQTAQHSFLYGRLMQCMEILRMRRIVFGVSICVTHYNYRRILTKAYLNELYRRGCSVVLYEEYVPESPEKEGLGLSPVVRDYVEETLERMQNDFPELLMTMLPRTETEANRSILLREGCFRIDPTGVVHTGPNRCDGTLNVFELPLQEILKDSLYQCFQAARPVRPEMPGYVSYKNAFAG